jgi:carbamoylphosphate synthase large subunit
VTAIWFNQGFSGVRDALQMIREGAGDRARLLASHSDAHSPVFDAADLGFIEPALKGAAYVDYCLDICRQQSVDLFVPQGGRKLIAARKAEFAAIGTQVALVADAKTLALVDDKARFYNVAMDAGIAMPWTREIGDADEFDGALAELGARGLPACVKPPIGVFASGFWQLDERQSLFSTLMDAESHVMSPAAMRVAIAAETTPVRLLVLEFLPGDEWSVDCVAKDGRLVVGVGRRKYERAQLLEVDGPIFDIAAQAIKTFGLSGLINVQCRASADPEDLRLLEVNTRMSGGCLYTRYAGVNLPWLHVALELGWIDEADVPTPIGGAIVGPSAEARLISAKPHNLHLVEPIDA